MDFNNFFNDFSLYMWEQNHGVENSNNPILDELYKNIF